MNDYKKYWVILAGFCAEVISMWQDLFLSLFFLLLIHSKLRQKLCFFSLAGKFFKELEALGCKSLTTYTVQIVLKFLDVSFFTTYRNTEVFIYL